MEPTVVDPADRPVGPRWFIQMLLGFSVFSTMAMVVTPIVGFLVPPKTAGAGGGGRVLAATTADLPIGSGKVVAMGSKPVIVVNTPGGVKAYSAVCTHLGCIVAYDYDGPNARPNTSVSSATGFGRDDPAGFNVQMTNWCAQCHIRYMAASGSRSTVANGGNGTGGVDPIYSYRHTTARNRTCTTCHVAHGTNAVMNQVPADGTTYSANVPWPGTNGTTVGDSRLLKVDNRGTCQLCHDPTRGSAATQHVPPVTTLDQGPFLLFPQ